MLPGRMGGFVVASLLCTALTAASGAVNAGGPAAFVEAADRVLLVAVAFLVAAFTVTWWLPRHAREHA